MHRHVRIALWAGAGALLAGIGFAGQAGALDLHKWDLRAASFESTLQDNVDFGWRVDPPFSVTRTKEAGTPSGDYAAKIVTRGGNSGCSCPRMTFQDGFAFGPGDELRMGGSWRIPEPSKLAWSRLMNLGHFEESGDPDNWLLGVLVRDGDTMQVTATDYDYRSPSVLAEGISIPKDRWFSLDVHLKLSPTDGEALTEVFLDGELVASTTKRNMVSGRPLHFYNAGVPYFWPGNGNQTIYFDAPRLIY